MVEKIKPLEEFVMEGFQGRFQQVFDCPCIYTTGNDKTKVLHRLFEGKEVVYPYAFLNVLTVGPNNESYNPHQLGRRGQIVTVKDRFAGTAKLMPANFDLEVEYYTPRYQGFDQDSVLSFMRRWIFARRFGYLKFNINYGKLKLWCSVTLGDSIQSPPRENIVEVETAYKVTANLTIHGYISEPTLSTVGIVQQIVVNGVVMNADGSMPGQQFFSFN